MKPLNTLFAVFSATLCLGACHTMPSEPSADFSAPHTALLPQAQEWMLKSRNTGRTYRIQTAAVGKPPKGGYPVLYLLDGDAYFPAAAVTAQSLEMRAEENRASPLLIVAVGYPGGKLLDSAARAQDYTPPSDDYSQTGDRVNAKFGGADAFERFLNGELKPRLAEKFSVNPNRQALFGHSYGGLFALYSLLEGSGGFDTYLIASPSVWWNGRRIVQNLSGFGRRRLSQPQPPVRVRLSVGEYEETPAPHLPPSDKRRDMLKQRGMVRETRHLDTALAKLPGLDVEMRIYPQQTHASSAFYALSDGIRTVMAHCLDDAACRPSESEAAP